MTDDVKYRYGAAMPGETCEQRNMRMGWGCACHGETFCPDLQFVGYENDVPIFAPKEAQMEFRCYSCKQVFSESAAREHFGSTLARDLPKCLEVIDGKANWGGGVHDPYIRVLKSHYDELSALLEIERANNTRLAASLPECEELAELQDTAADLRARLTAAQEENAKLRKALEPFTGYVVRGIYHKGVDRRTPQIEREAVWEITLPASSQQPMFKHFDDARTALPAPQPKEPSP